MHIEIDHRHALHAVPAARMQGGDRRLVEDTEAHRALGLRMVATGPRGTEHVARRAGHHVIDAGAGRADAAQDRLERARRHHGVATIQRPMALRRCDRLHPGYIVAGVHQFHLLHTAERRLAPDQVGEVRRLQCLLHGQQTLGRFRVMRAGLVAKAGVVAVDQRGHRRLQEG
jgi:hypothetical protein